MTINDISTTAERPRGAMRLVTLASGKGGVGKSSFAVNLAIALSQLGSRVLVVDADFGLANIDVMLGAQMKYNLSHFLRGEKRLDEIVHIGYDGVRFISGGSGSTELMKVTNNQLHSLLQGIQDLDMAIDFVLLDVGAGIHEPLLTLINASHELIVVTTPEPTAILDAYALIKSIGTAAAETLAINVVMNQSESAREARHVFTGLASLLEKNLGYEARLLSPIVFDAEVSRSIKKQTPVMVSAPMSSYARDVRAVAREMMNLPPVKEYANFFTRLIARIQGDTD